MKTRTELITTFITHERTFYIIALYNDSTNWERCTVAAESKYFKNGRLTKQLGFKELIHPMIKNNIPSLLNEIEKKVNHDELMEKGYSLWEAFAIAYMGSTPLEAAEYAKKMAELGI